MQNKANDTTKATTTTKGPKLVKAKAQDTTTAQAPTAQAPTAQAPTAQATTTTGQSKLMDTLTTMTPEQAAAILNERQAKLKAAAAKAHATRKANGTASNSAKAAWATRRAFNEALKALAAKAK